MTPLPRELQLCSRSFLELCAGLCPPTAVYLSKRCEISAPVMLLPPRAVDRDAYLWYWATFANSCFTLPLTSPATSTFTIVSLHPKPSAGVREIGGLP